MGSQHSKLGLGDDNQPNMDGGLKGDIPSGGFSEAKARGTETPNEESTNYLNMNMIPSASS